MPGHPVPALMQLVVLCRDDEKREQESDVLQQTAGNETGPVGHTCYNWFVLTLGLRYTLVYYIGVAS